MISSVLSNIEQSTSSVSAQQGRIMLPPCRTTRTPTIASIVYHSPTTAVTVILTVKFSLYTITKIINQVPREFSRKGCEMHSCELPPRRRHARNAPMAPYFLGEAQAQPLHRLNHCSLQELSIFPKARL